MLSFISLCVLSAWCASSLFFWLKAVTPLSTVIDYGCIVCIECVCGHLLWCVWELGQSWGTHSVSGHLSPSSWNSVNYYLPALRRQAHHGALRWGLSQSSVMGLIMHLHAEAHLWDSKMPLTQPLCRKFTGNTNISGSIHTRIKSRNPRFRQLWPKGMILHLHPNSIKSLLKII